MEIYRNMPAAQVIYVRDAALCAISIDIIQRIWKIVSSATGRSGHRTIPPKNPIIEAAENGQNL